MSGPARSLAALTHDVRALLDPVDGDFAVAVRPLDAPGQTLLIREHELFHAASTMKTPVMVELFRQAHEGRFALDDSIEVKNEFASIVDGSPYALTPAADSYDALYDHLGETRPIRTLMRAMITASSNLATNLLLERVGADNVTETMRRYGAERLRVRRGVEDLKAFRRGLNNETTAHDLLVLYERMARREVVSAAASDEMIDILTDQAHTDIIPARLPDSVTVAHKPGWIAGLHHDAGIVVGPDGSTYVLVLLAQNLEDEEAGIDALARTSRTIFDGVTQ